MPPVEPEEPTYPFQSICADFFTLNSQSYLTVVDRYSNWLTLWKLPKDTTAQTLTCFRDYISTFGIPVTLTTDGAKVFTSKEFEDFCHKWGIIHRVSTAYNPSANKRAELAVKHAKRLVRGNTSQTGSLNTDEAVKAVLSHRNTPCSITGLSPAQIVFGRQVRDPLPLQPSKFFPRQEWRQAAEARAQAHAKTRVATQERMTKGTKNLPSLQVGDHVFIQNQTGNNPNQWNKTGVVVEVGPHYSYLVSVDGSRNITKRNRKFLRKFSPNPEPTIRSRPAPAVNPQTIADTICTPPQRVMNEQVPIPLEVDEPDLSLDPNATQPLPIVDQNLTDTSKTTEAPHNTGYYFPPQTPAATPALQPSATVTNPPLPMTFRRTDGQWHVAPPTPPNMITPIMPFPHPLGPYHYPSYSGPSYDMAMMCCPVPAYHTTRPSPAQGGGGHQQYGYAASMLPATRQ